LAALALAILLCLFADGALAAQRALIVGIDRYRTADPAVAATRGKVPAAKSWVDLRGAVNDSESLRSLLLQRFGFQSESVRVLTDGEATREAILTAIQEHLVEASAPGDVNLFYFAGHGSQLRNTASSEMDLLDETLVPADANRGVSDIRDKELRTLFNDVLDRGAELIVILDSCHSGSATRSLHALEDVRTLPPRFTEDAADSALAEDGRGDPEERGALVLAAASDGELAREARDASGRYHGAFSFALLEALRTAPSDEPVSQLFARVRALLGRAVDTQTPVLAGPLERRGRPLFGAAQASNVSDRYFASLGPARGELIDLRAGTAAGVFRGSELVAEDRPGVPLLRARVERVDGLNRSTARVIEGRPSTVRTGTLFRVERWAPPAGGALQVALPALVPPALRQELAREIPSVAGVDLVDEPRAHYVLAVENADDAPRLYWQRRAREASDLPPRSDGVSEGAQNLAARLAAYAAELAAARTWLLLEPPADPGHFPYRLILRDSSGGRLVPGGVVFEGDIFELMLQREVSAKARPVERRYVYVFVVDGRGRRTLLFPRAESGNAENRLPVSVDGPGPSLIPLGNTAIEVAPPFGTDTLVLLSTADPIDDPSVLIGEARKTRGQSWVDNLLESARGSRETSRRKAWAIERVALRSMPRS
jgi:hypothetical protein